jgi:hypothetical protein
MEAAWSIRGWLSIRHSLRAEVLAVVLLYAAYEATRGVVSAHEALAVRHADDVVAAERALHLFVERNVQDAAERISGVTGALGFAYLTLHLATTCALLLWLHRRRPLAYPFVRTTLLVASVLALVGYLAFPTAPPRLTPLGILDTVSGHGAVDLNEGLVSSLYNPYAAMPSMHAGYAVIIGATIVRETRHLALRLAAVAYPAFVVVVIVSTGNHFFLDAAAGVTVAALAAGITRLLLSPRR